MKTNKIIKNLFGTALPLLAVFALITSANAQPVARIVFQGSGTLSPQRNAPSVSGLFAMNPDGTGLVQLCNNSQAVNPAWSPGQAYVAYQTSMLPSTIYVMDAIGTLHGGRAFPVAQGRSPDWSPDGTLIVFQGADYNLYIVPVNPVAGKAGTPVPFVVDTSHKYEPSWSPDGTRIAFERTTSSSTSAIFIRDVSTGVEVELPTPFAGVMMVPRWSPDSGIITFLAVNNANHTEGVYLVNADGTGLQPFPNYPNAGATAPTYPPTWSPDGSAIALTLKVPISKNSYQLSVCKQNLATGAVTVLTPATLTAINPDWTP